MALAPAAAVAPVPVVPVPVAPVLVALPLDGLVWLGVAGCDGACELALDEAELELC